jgi:hypothetical protein
MTGKERGLPKQKKNVNIEIKNSWTPIDGKSNENSKIRLNMKMSFHPKYATPSTDALSKTMPQDNNSKNEKDEEPFDPEHTNGILSVTIHQAVDLEIGDPATLPSDDRFKHPYNPGAVVNPYALLYVNDNKVFRTRTKLRNPSPVSLSFPLLLAFIYIIK